MRINRKEKAPIDTEEKYVGDNGQYLSINRPNGTTLIIPWDQILDIELEATEKFTCKNERRN